MRSSPPRVSTRTGESSEPAPDARDHRRACAGPARERLAGAALPNAQANGSAIDDLHVTRVDAIRKSRMALDRRAPASRPAPRRRRRTTCTACGLPIDSAEMRTVVPPTSSVSSTAPVAADERDLLRAKSRHAHVDGDLAVGLEPRHDEPAGGFDADLALVGQPAIAHEHDEAARAVAALLDLAAVGVEDPVAKVGVAAARARRPAPGRSRRRSGDRPARGPSAASRSTRWRTPSMTTKSLPRPCILVNLSVIAAAPCEAAGISPVASEGNGVSRRRASRRPRRHSAASARASAAFARRRAVSVAAQQCRRPIRPHGQRRRALPPRAGTPDRRGEVRGRRSRRPRCAGPRRCASTAISRSLGLARFKHDAELRVGRCVMPVDAHADRPRPSAARAAAWSRSRQRQRTQRRTQRKRAARRRLLDIEPEMHDVAVLDDVLLAFEPHLARFLGALLALAARRSRRRSSLPRG